MIDLSNVCGPAVEAPTWRANHLQYEGRILGLSPAALVFLAHEPGEFVERQDFGEGHQS